MHILKGHKEFVNSAQFSHDNQKIVTASADNTVRIWNTLNGTCLYILKGHTNLVNSAQFSSDNQKIVTASRDKTVRIFYANNGTCIHILEGHTDWVSAAQFSSDNKKIVTTSRDNTVRIWNIEPFNKAYKFMETISLSNAFMLYKSCVQKDEDHAFYRLPKPIQESVKKVRLTQILFK